MIAVKSVMVGSGERLGRWACVTLIRQAQLFLAIFCCPPDSTEAVPEVALGVSKHADWLRS